jgi:hypothetical protein
MGAIKDIVDLCIDLQSQIGNRRAAEVIGKIQSHTLALQSEHAAIVEKNAELLTTNLNLKHKIFDSESSHSKTVAKLEAKIAELEAQNSGRAHHFLDDYDHFPRYGLYKKKGGNGAFLCGTCLPGEQVSPVQEMPHGWRCNVCDKWFDNPDRPSPPMPPPDSGWLSSHSAF